MEHSKTKKILVMGAAVILIAALLAFLFTDKSKNLNMKLKGNALVSANTTKYGVLYFYTDSFGGSINCGQFYTTGFTSDGKIIEYGMHNEENVKDVYTSFVNDTIYFYTKTENNLYVNKFPEGMDAAEDIIKTITPNERRYTIKKDNTCTDIIANLSQTESKITIKSNGDTEQIIYSINDSINTGLCVTGDYVYISVEPSIHGHNRFNASIFRYRQLINVLDTIALNGKGYGEIPNKYSITGFKDASNPIVFANVVDTIYNIIVNGNQYKYKFFYSDNMHEVGIGTQAHLVCSVDSTDNIYYYGTSYEVPLTFRKIFYDRIYKHHKNKNSDVLIYKNLTWGRMSYLIVGSNLMYIINEGKNIKRRTI